MRGGSWGRIEAARGGARAPPPRRSGASARSDGGVGRRARADRANLLYRQPGTARFYDARPAAASLLARKEPVEPRSTRGLGGPLAQEDRVVCRAVRRVSRRCGRAKRSRSATSATGTRTASAAIRASRDQGTRLKRQWLQRTKRQAVVAEDVAARPPSGDRPRRPASRFQHSVTSTRWERSRANWCPAEAGVRSGSGSAAVDQLSDALAGETGEPSEEAVGGSCSVCGPQRRSQPAPGSLELGLGSADSLEGFRNSGQSGRKLRHRLLPAGHGSGLRLTGAVSFLPGICPDRNR